VHVKDGITLAGAAVSGRKIDQHIAPVAKRRRGKIGVAPDIAGQGVVVAHRPQ